MTTNNPFSLVMISHLLVYYYTSILGICHVQLKHKGVISQCFNINNHHACTFHIKVLGNKLKITLINHYSYTVTCFIIYGSNITFL